MAYVAYVSNTQRWVMIHRQDCSFAQRRLTSAHDDCWHGPFDGIATALEHAQIVGFKPEMCRRCKPAEGRLDLSIAHAAE